MSRLLALAAVVLSATAAIAQRPPDGPPPPPRPAVSADGTEVFRWLLHSRGVKPLTAAEFQRRLRTDAFGDVIVVVLGVADRGPLAGPTVGSWAAAALRGGGAGLVAVDTGYTFPPPFSRLHLAGGWRVTHPDPAETYLGNESCPFAEPRDPPRRLVGPGPEWGLFAGLNRVATNRPTTLSLQAHADEFGSVLAGFRPGTRVDGGRVNLDDLRYALAAGGSGPHPASQLPYRFLAVADPDVFANEMMVPTAGEPAPDNLEFAGRVVSFLVEEDGDDRRKACLFVQNGQVVDRFDALRGLLRPPSPPLELPNVLQLQDKFVDFGDRRVDQVQEADVPGKAAVGTGDEASQRSRLRDIAEALLVLAAVWAALAVVRRVWGARHPTNVSPAPPAGRPVPNDGSRPAGVFDRRQKELLRRDDLAEPVRAAVREMFLAAGAPPDAGPRLPKVTVTREVRRPDTLRAALRDLWEIGFARPGRVTARRWAVLEPLFVRARKAHDDGKWAFVSPDPA